MADSDGHDPSSNLIYVYIKTNISQEARTGPPAFLLSIFPSLPASPPGPPQAARARRARAGEAGSAGSYPRRRRDYREEKRISLLESVCEGTLASVWGHTGRTRHPQGEEGQG